MNEEPISALSLYFRKINSSWYQIFVAYLKDADVNVTEGTVMLAINALDHPTKSEISIFLKFKQQNITRALHGLLDKGYLLREVDKQDYRCMRIKLTAKGKKFVKNMQAYINKTWDRLMSRFDQQQSQIFMHCLADIVENIDDCLPSN